MQNQTISQLVRTFVEVINLTVEVLSALALVLFFVGCVRYVYRSNMGGKTAGDDRKIIGWSLIALFILFSMWGILALFSKMVFNTGTATGEPLELHPTVRY